MAKFNDKIAVLLSVATISFVGGAYITDSYAWGIAFALLSMLATVLATKILPKRQKGVSLGQFTAMLLLEGKALSTAYLYRLYPPIDPEHAATDESERTANDRQRLSDICDVTPTEPRDAYYDREGRYVVNALGYGKAGEEWAAKIYRTLKPAKVRMVVAVVDVDRKALAILGAVAEDIKVLHPKELLRRLHKVGVRPTCDRARTRLSAKVLLSSLSYRHAYLFALSAAGCALFSLFLPIKTYYYAFAIANALLAIGVVAVKKLVKE